MNELFSSYPLVVNKKLAKLLGLNEAMILHQINYWININKKKNNNFYNKRYWTCNTINAGKKNFHFGVKKQ